MAFEDLDLSNIEQLAKPEIISRINDALIVGPVLTIWLLTMALFLIFGLLMVQEDRGRLITLWVIVLILSGIFVLGIIFLPNTAQTFVSGIANFFSFN